MTSAVPTPEPRDSTTIIGRTYGYVRASIIDDVDSPEAQAGIIATHCRGIGRGLDEVFFDDALSGGLPLAKREGGKRLLPNLRKGDHVVVARSDLMCRSFIEFVRTLDGWAELGVAVHLCDVPIGPLDPESTPVRLVIDFLVSFNGSESRRIATRCRQVADSLKAEGRRYTRFAPFGFRWEKRGRYTVLVPEPIEQRLCIKAAEMRLQGYSWHQIRRYFAYEWRVRNRVGNQFGYAEIREMTFRGLELLRAAGSLERDPADRPA
jgi:DNA invertase Pin-like site-specific DNA recombinase